MYFAHVLTNRSHSLYLPQEAREDIARLVSAHQRTKASREMAPFRRQVDFWLLCLGVALADDLQPREGAPASWGYKFVDTREVQLPSEIYNLLAIIAFEQMEHDADRIDDPSRIIDAANSLAGAACSHVLAAVTSKELRHSPLDKALTVARGALNRATG
ncbi:MAG: hypothetical protein OXP28_11940 [Gammaproteobacteria bacterium]|nr:hypothetical protein [Gammaproteobacteria bacterium]